MMIVTTNKASSTRAPPQPITVAANRLTHWKAMKKLDVGFGSVQGVLPVSAFESFGVVLPVKPKSPPPPPLLQKQKQDQKNTPSSPPSLPLSREHARSLSPSSFSPSLSPRTEKTEKTENNKLSNVDRLRLQLEETEKELERVRVELANAEKLKRREEGEPIPQKPRVPPLAGLRQAVSKGAVGVVRQRLAKSLFGGRNQGIPKSLFASSNSNSNSNSNSKKSNSKLSNSNSKLLNSNSKLSNANSKLSNNTERRQPPPSAKSNKQLLNKVPYNAKSQAIRRLSVPRPQPTSVTVDAKGKKVYQFALRGSVASSLAGQFCECIVEFCGLVGGGVLAAARTHSDDNDNTRKHRMRDDADDTKHGNGMLQLTVSNRATASTVNLACKTILFPSLSTNACLRKLARIGVDAKLTQVSSDFSSHYVLSLTLL
jgi:hypothetical protein